MKNRLEQIKLLDQDDEPITGIASVTISSEGVLIVTISGQIYSDIPRLVDLYKAKVIKKLKEESIKRAQ